MTDIASTHTAPPDLTLVLVHLFKGPLYHDTHEKLWAKLLEQRTAVVDYVAVIGLQLNVDESEGYAFLQSKPTNDDSLDLPRLVARRSLSLRVSLLLALLRKRLAEFDSADSEVRLILSRQQIVEMISLYRPDATNEARLVELIETDINKVIELGYLRKMRGSDDRYEVRRIIKAYIDGQWLAELDRHLDDYLTELGRPGPNSGEELTSDDSSETYAVPLHEAELDHRSTLAAAEGAVTADVVGD